MARDAPGGLSEPRGHVFRYHKASRILAAWYLVWVSIIRFLTFDPLPPAVARDQPAAFSPAGTQVVSDSPVITVDAPASVVEPLPPGFRFPIIGIPVCNPLLPKSEANELSSRLPSEAVRQVRPEVKEFLKQVVVPILVERYIASLKQKKMAARALEAE